MHSAKVCSLLFPILLASSMLVARPQAAAPGPQPKVGQATPAGDPEDRVLGHLGKRVLKDSDFKKWLKAIAGPRYDSVVKNPPTLAKAMKQYLDTQVLAAKAKKDGVQKLPAYRELLAIQEQQALIQTMLNEEHKGGVGERLKAKTENPTEAEIRAFFDKNTQRYETPEKFTARHILVTVTGAPRGAKGLPDEEAKAKILKIKEDLKAGQKFEEAAKAHSDDPGSKDKGGLCQDITFGTFAKEFEEAVRKQELGQVGDPVKTVYGYHLILVEGRTPKQPAVFEKARDTVKQQMLPGRKEEVFKAFLEEAQKEVGYVEAPGVAQVMAPPSGPQTGPGRMPPPRPVSPPVAPVPPPPAPPVK